jgi:VIT1/CCC1 family predicted Fe2+/Mn2+ transporter
MDMSTQQLPEPAAQATRVRSDDSLDGGLFLAGVAIGIAPAALTAGIMLDSRVVSVGVTGALLLMGFVVAAVSSEL